MLAMQSRIGIGRKWADASPYFYLSNAKGNICKRHGMYVKHNFQVFQCLWTLFKNTYLDYTFKDESIIESNERFFLIV